MKMSENNDFSHGMIEQ